MLQRMYRVLPVIDKEPQYREVKRAGKWGTWGSVLASHHFLHSRFFSSCSSLGIYVCIPHLPQRLLSWSAHGLEQHCVQTDSSFTPSTKTGVKQAPCVCQELCQTLRNLLFHNKEMDPVFFLQQILLSQLAKSEYFLQEDTNSGW